MKTEALPQTDSIQELAEFWDKHDLTNFEDDLEVVTEPVFAPRTAIRLDLGSADADAVWKISKATAFKIRNLFMRGFAKRSLHAEGVK